MPELRPHDTEVIGYDPLVNKSPLFVLLVQKGALSMFSSITRIFPAKLPSGSFWQST